MGQRPSQSRFNLEKWFRSVALIRQVDNGKNRWLARARPATRVKPATSTILDFVSAPRLESESFRETIQREVAWVLGLNRRRDFLVSNMAQLNLEFVACLPTGDSESHIAAAFFLVEIYNETAHETIRVDPANRWLTSAEVCAGQTDNGEALDPRLVFLLDRARVIQPWD